MYLHEVWGRDQTPSIPLDGGSYPSYLDIKEKSDIERLETLCYIIHVIRI